MLDNCEGHPLVSSIRGIGLKTGVPRKSIAQELAKRKRNQNETFVRQVHKIDLRLQAGAEQLLSNPHFQAMRSKSVRCQ